MNIKFIQELILDIYIKKELIGNIDFNNKEDLEKYLKRLFKVLKNKYNIIIEGFYDITIYIDKYYGIVIHMEKDDVEYYNFYKNQVDMRITTIDVDFLYLVEDIPDDILNKIDVIVKDKDIYIKIKEELSKIEMMKLLEISRVVVI